jgi:hypothetical protein
MFFTQSEMVTQFPKEAVEDPPSCPAHWSGVVVHKQCTEAWPLVLVYVYRIPPSFPSLWASEMLKQYWQFTCMDHSRDWLNVGNSCFKSLALHTASAIGRHLLNAFSKHCADMLFSFLYHAHTKQTLTPMLWALPITQGSSFRNLCICLPHSPEHSVRSRAMPSSCFHPASTVPTWTQKVPRQCLLHWTQLQ